jgi:hypothetical protein
MAKLVPAIFKLGRLFCDDVAAVHNSQHFQRSERMGQLHPLITSTFAQNIGHRKKYVYFIADVTREEQNTLLQLLAFTQDRTIVYHTQRNRRDFICIHQCRG